MISKTYLVTGAAGFIGAALAKQFIELGSEVVTIDNLSTGFRESIPEGVIFIEGDCQEKSIINQLIPINLMPFFILLDKVQVRYLLKTLYMIYRLILNPLYYY